jgi:hypothetical protein
VRSCDDRRRGRRRRRRAHLFILSLPQLGISFFLSSQFCSVLFSFFLEATVALTIESGEESNLSKQMKAKNRTLLGRKERRTQRKERGRSKNSKYGNQTHQLDHKE